MDEWKEYKTEEKLGNYILDIAAGPFGSNLKVDCFVSQGFPIIDGANLKGFKVTDNVTKFVTENKARSLYRSIAKRNDVVVTISGNVGQIAYIPQNSTYEEYLVSQRQFRVTFDTTKVFVPYLIYYFHTKEGQHKILSFANQTGVPALAQPLKNFKNINISLPSLPEQTKIASILSSLDDKIELNRRINRNLEEQAQALFKSWFVDFEPFKDGEFVDSELGMIPKGWRVGDIYQYVDVIYGAPYKSSLFNDKGKGLPLIRIRDLKTFSPQFYTPEVMSQTEYVEMGDVIAGMDAEFIPCLWLGKKGVLNQRCCKFVPKYDDISNYFVLYWLRPELEFVQSYKTGTTVSHLGKSDIDRFVVVIPPIEEVIRFSVIADAMLKEKLKLAKETIELSLLRDTLLPRLMSGALKV